MRYILILAIISFLGGCAVAGKAEKIDTGIYIISVNSNAIANKQIIEASFKKAAKKACGDDNYKLRELLPTEIEKIRTYGAGYNSTVSVRVQKRIVECI